jgi:hypothetical protein
VLPCWEITYKFSVTKAEENMRKRVKVKKEGVRINNRNTGQKVCTEK